MKIRHIDHVGIIVDDLAAAKAFFLDFGLAVLGEGGATGAWMDRIVGLDGVQTTFVMMGPPDGQANIELIKFHTPPDEHGIRPAFANTPGLRHIAFVVEDIEALVAKLRKNSTEPFSAIHRFEGSYQLCYVHGPEGIIIELAEEIG